MYFDEDEPAKKKEKEGRKRVIKLNFSPDQSSKSFK